jgi:hypothetical protein
MIKAGVYAKKIQNSDPFLLADSLGKGWHFSLNKDGHGDYPTRNGGWSNKHDKAEYDECNMIMPFNLWVF